MRVIVVLREVLFYFYLNSWVMSIIGSVRRRYGGHDALEEREA
jgi:hypothetical protein